MLGGSMSRVAMEYARASEESHQLELQMWSPLADAPAPQTPAPSPPVTPRPGTSEGGRGGTPGTVTRRLYATPLQQEGGLGAAALDWPGSSASSAAASEGRKKRTAAAAVATTAAAVKGAGASGSAKKKRRKRTRSGDAVGKKQQEN